MEAANRIIRLPEVLNLTGLKRATVYLKIKQGQFPKSISLGPRAAGWVQAEIQQWIAERISDRDSK